MFPRGLLDFFLPGSCAGCGSRLVPEDRDRLLCARCGSRLRSPEAPGCRRCGAPLGTARSSGRPCIECGGWPPALRLARSAVVLEPPADRLVHALKYEGWRRLGDPMASRMVVPGRDLVRQLESPAAGTSPDARYGGEAPTATRAREWGGAEGTGPGPVCIVPVATSPARQRSRGYNQARVLAVGVARALGRPLLDALERRDGSGTQVALQPQERLANVRRAFRVAAGAHHGLAGRPVLLVDDVLTTGATAVAAAEALVGSGSREVALLTFARSLPRSARRNDPVEDPEALAELLDPVLPGAWNRGRGKDGETARRG